MNRRTLLAGARLAGIGVTLVLGGLADAQVRRPAAQLRKDRMMSPRATGTFDVKLAPLPLSATADATLGRMSLDKVFRGDLAATGHGEMLTATTAVDGSAGYVAIERITGTLHGRAGSFVLQHLGTMTRGVGEMTITVVPDSGTGALAGITGKLAIHLVDGKHSYDFDYALPR